jgi:hypothetical protein
LSVPIECRNGAQISINQSLNAAIFGPLIASSELNK